MSGDKARDGGAKSRHAGAPSEAGGQAEAGPGLPALRKQLDEIDAELVRLLARRLDTVGLVSQAKASQSAGIRDPEREREVLARADALAQSLGVSAPLVRKIFSEIITHSVTRQAAALSGLAGATHEITVAYPGSASSFNYLAAEKYAAAVGLRGRLLGARSSKDAVDALAAGVAALAFVPIESTTAGSINDVYEILRERDVHIVGEEIYRVDHCLAATADVPLAALVRVLGDAASLEQCSTFVASLPQAAATVCADAAEAMRRVAESKDPTIAAVGSPEAAASHGLTVVRRGIGNLEEIYTRHVALALAPGTFDTRVPCKTSLILSTRHEQGALVRCLQVLADYGLSLTKLESRPRPNRPWEYSFFVDFEGNLADAKVAAALEQLRSQSLFLKVLGCYPAKATPVAAQAPALAPADVRATGSTFPSAAAADGQDAPAAPPAAAPKHYKLASRATRAEDTVVRVGDLLIGGGGFVVMAGPCSVESKEQIDTTARFVREHGAHVLRGGVFKPRTSPYAFQGLGYDGLDLLAAAGKAAGLPIVTEVMAPEQVRAVAEKADVLQIGARNMQNFPLLSEVGRVDRPVLLKRGLSSTIDEWLAAAEYILAQGNGQVILCERGIRTFESATRNTLDLSAVVVLRERTHLPVVVDPSHGTGKRAYVAPMAMAARAAGAHGLLIEVHPDPDRALSDGDQSLTLAQFASLMDGLSRLRV